MKVADEMNNVVSAMKSRILHDEIELGKSLQEEAEVLFHAMFQQNSDRKKNKEEHISLLERMKEFERNLVNVQILNFLYAVMARVALNCHNFKDVFQYAHAGIEVNQQQGDSDGVRSNNRVILDTACMMTAYKSAIKIMTENPDIADQNAIAMMENMNSEGDAMFHVLMQSTERPSTLALCLDEKLRNEEGAIKTLMLQMGISRKTALQYKATADNLPDSHSEGE